MFQPCWQRTLNMEAVKIPIISKQTWGIFDPALNPLNSKLYQFLDTFYNEISELFPDDYIHIGGDEVNGKEWDGNMSLHQAMKDSGILDNKQLQEYFTNHLIPLISRHGKKVMGWDEILLPGISFDAIIQCWRGKEAMIEAARKGYQIVLSYGYYLDLFPSAADLYINEPLPEGISLTSEQKSRILGGEAAMWSEYVDS